MHLTLITFLFLQAIAWVDSANVRWTFHESCYKDEDVLKALTQAMGTAKTRSAQAASGLAKTTSPVYLGKLKKPAKLLLGDKNYNANAKLAISKFKDISTLLEGPIGEKDKKYADSDDWKKLADDSNHCRDFVIYCAPDLGTYTYGDHSAPYDNARARILSGQATTLVKMKTETDAGTWTDPKSKSVAVTEVDDATTATLNPGADRNKIPETITFHPLYLQDIKDHGFSLLTDKKITTATATGAVDQFENYGVTPVDSLMGLEGTLHHELFHLSAFGKLTDRSDDAYLWSNNVNKPDLDNPEWFAFLGLIFDLVKRKLTVAESGAVSDA